MESWKDRIMNSLEGAKPAEPATDLFAGIQARIQKPVMMHVVKRPYLALAAASLAIFVSANVYMLSAESSPNATVGSSAYQVQLADFNVY